MIDTFDEAYKLMKDVLIDKLDIWITCDGPVCEKLAELTRIILNAERIEDNMSNIKNFDIIILPFKDIKFRFHKTYKSLFISTIYPDIDKLDFPNKVFKHIITSIHSKLKEKYNTKIITCAIIDVMIYCIINEIEINVMDFINVNWGEMLKKKPISFSKYLTTKLKFDDVIPDGYMKDILSKAFDQEVYNALMHYTYSIVDIAESMKLSII